MKSVFNFKTFNINNVMRRNEPGRILSPELAVARAVGAQSPKIKKKLLK